MLAPHPDDEVFGCGGAIAAHVQAAIPVKVVVLSDGARFGDASVRSRECIAAAKGICAMSPFFCSAISYIKNN